MKWKATTNATYRTMYQCTSEDWGWQITFPQRAPDQPTVELRYGRRAPGDVVPHMMDIGRFASEAEAMLGARMFVEGATQTAPATTRKELGFKTYFEGAEKLDLKKDKAGYFLFATAIGLRQQEMDLEYQPAGRSKDTHDVARLWSSTSSDPDFMPAADTTTARAIEESILMELLRIRLERGPGHHHEPLTLEEFGAWQVNRYGKEVDPDTDRPYSLSSPEVRNAIAAELLLGDATLRERLRISPGFEERIGSNPRNMDGLLEELVFAHLRGDERTELLDRLDGMVTTSEPAPLSL